MYSQCFMLFSQNHWCFWHTFGYVISDGAMRMARLLAKSPNAPRASLQVVSFKREGNMRRRKRRVPRKHKQIAVPRQIAPTTAEPFASDDGVLQVALQMFRARKTVVEAGVYDSDDVDRVESLRREDTAWTKYFHTAFSRTDDAAVSLCALCRKHRLNRLEREIILALVQSELGLGENVRTCAELLAALVLPGDKIVKALRTVSEGGRLYSLGLVCHEDPDEDVGDRVIVLDPAIVEGVLQTSSFRRGAWPVKTEAELPNRLGRLTRALFKKSNELNNILRGNGCAGDFFKARRKVQRLLSGLHRTLDLHRSWKLSKLHEEFRSRSVDWTILMALLGKALGHLDADSPLFKGAGLAKAASGEIEDVSQVLQCLRSDHYLATEGYVRSCVGLGEALSDDAEALEKTEFEVTEKVVEALGLDKSRIKKRSGKYEVREPRMRMEQMVLSENLHRALGMAITHAKNAHTLVEDWGLGEIFSYGHSVTLLFSGPPGTGKTASAEALARELGKPILVANYAEIQNCFVGMTEKNIARTFREAKAHDAVLFWDEADAMFYDRDSASRNWEVRDVNVLLQELERFEGVCVLATNRKVALDKALERRITMKVEFERPDREARRGIWEKMLPKKMPLAQDVDLDRLAEADLSGGEIKNVVLNAARLALQRGGKAKVTMNDLLKAVDMETEGKWSENGGSGIGFSV